MLEGYTRRYFCWLSGTPDEPERAEEEVFLPADAQQPEGACGGRRARTEEEILG